jgi:predicted dehydrogenase
VHRFPALRPSPRWIVNPALSIGIIGAGRIVRDAHLPAYRKAGFPVGGLYDRDEARARELAAAYGLRWCRSIEELLSDEAIAVVDIAVPGFAQPALAR